MKKFLALPLIGFLCSSVAASAAVLNFDLSPPGTDTAVGLSPSNEVPPTVSTGSGGVIAPGITFDTTTLTLNFSIGYGSASGFSNLTGPATAARIDGPSPTNTHAPAAFDLSSFVVPATNPADGGTITGSLVLTSVEASNLLAGLYSVNIDTASNDVGEIRGQLIPIGPVNTAIILDCPSPVVAQCAGPGGTPAALTAAVSDTNGNALTIVWSINGTPAQTNTVAAGISTNINDVTLVSLFDVGTNAVDISVTDGVDFNSCSTTVSIVDTNPPVITSLSVSPNTLWPPNHKLVPIKVSITATDACGGQVTSKIVSITSNEPVPGPGKKFAPDWIVTSDLTAKLRAERLGKGDGRTYTITVEAIGPSGASTNGTVTVTVPHDQGHGKKNGKGKH